MIGDSSKQFVFGEWFSQILLRPDQPASGAIEKAVFTGQHDDRRFPKRLVVLNQ